MNRSIPIIEIPFIEDRKRGTEIFVALNKFESAKSAMEDFQDIVNSINGSEKLLILGQISRVGGYIETKKEAAIETAINRFGSIFEFKNKKWFNYDGTEYEVTLSNDSIEMDSISFLAADFSNIAMTPIEALEALEAGTLTKSEEKIYPKK